MSYAGKIIGQIGADGSIISSDNKNIGRIWGSGQAVDKKGQMLGEIIDGDIVIDQQDKVVGFVTIDGQVLNKDQEIIGKSISANLVVDNNGKIMGHTYKIGANILGNDGKFFGRLAPDGSVLSITNGKIGYLKSNGSFINSRNKVAGYVLDEVARNRRN